MGIGDDGYWSIRDILGYNCTYNFVLSDRGRGKSYGTKLFLMNQEGTFMCLYRQEPDMVNAMASWMDTLYENGYDPTEFEWEKNKKGVYNLLYHGVRKAFFRCISHVNHIKQEKFPDDLNWVWLDEFIPEAYKKIPGVESEGDAIRTIVKTIDHDSAHSRESKGLKPLRVLMYGNPRTWNNPVLAYFRITPRYGIHRVGPGIVCEYLEPLEYSSEGPMTVDQFLGDGVHTYQGWNEELAFVVGRLPKNVIPDLSLRFVDRFYCLYWEKDTRLYYVVMKKGHVESHREGRTRWGTIERMQPSEVCLEGSNLLDRLKSGVYTGRYRFVDLNTKLQFMNDLEMIR